MPTADDTSSSVQDATNKSLSASPSIEKPRRRPLRETLIGGIALGLALLLGVVMYGLSGRTNIRPEPARISFDAVQAKLHQAAWASFLGIPVYDKNSIGMKLVLIPPGEFEMGMTEDEVTQGLKQDFTVKSSEATRECLRSSKPKHSAVVKQPYYLGVHEVTQHEYQQVMGRNPSNFKAGHKSVKADERPNCPVEQVPWNDAVEFCNNLSKLEGRTICYAEERGSWVLQPGSGYRLPSEAEWEFACRAGTTTKYSTGDDDEQLQAAAWTVETADNTTHPVAEHPPNPFGLRDMHGNVSEWCQELWNLEDYPNRTAPPAIIALDAKRVTRGGSWIQSACRDYCLQNAPTHVVGFRVVLSIDKARTERLAKLEP